MIKKIITLYNFKHNKDKFTNKTFNKLDKLALEYDKFACKLDAVCLKIYKLMTTKCKWIKLARKLEEYN